MQSRVFILCTFFILFLSTLAIPSSARASLSRADLTCPAHATANEDKTACTVDDGYYITEGSLETNDAVITICPQGYYCTGNVIDICDGNVHTVNSLGQYVVTGAADCLGCPAGFQCQDGIKTHNVSSTLNLIGGTIVLAVFVVAMLACGLYNSKSRKPREEIVVSEMSAM